MAAASVTFQDEKGQTFLEPGGEPGEEQAVVAGPTTTGGGGGGRAARRPPGSLRAAELLLDENGMPRRDLGLPTLNGESINSLTSCSLNLDEGTCNFQTAQKFQHYLNEWRRPAPRHCQSPSMQRTVPLPELHPDRLGVNMEPICDRLQRRV